MASYRSPDSISDHIFHTPFPLKTIPVFRSGLYEIITSLLWLECRQKRFFKSIRIRILLFLSYSCWIKTANTFIHYRSRSSIESHSRFPEENGAKTIPFRMGRDIALWLIKGSTSPSPPLRAIWSRLYPKKKGVRVLVHKHITSPLSRTSTVPLAKTNRYLFSVIYVRAPAVGYELRNWKASYWKY